MVLSTPSEGATAGIIRQARELNPSIYVIARAGYLAEIPPLRTAGAKVQQASGGIVSPPTGSETEHYETVLTQASSNRFEGVNSTNTMAFDVWYDLPSLRREALVTVSLAFRDKENKTFTKNVEVRVAP